MRRILIVDDEPNIRRMLRLALADSFALAEAADADAAYALIQAERPAGVILDVMMPGSQNGFQLCERIKRDAALAATHVVLVTARAQVADQELGRALGADAYFVKPFSPTALLHHLRHALPDNALPATCASPP